MSSETKENQKVTKEMRRAGRDKKGKPQAILTLYSMNDTLVRRKERIIEKRKLQEKKRETVSIENI